MEPPSMNCLMNGDEESYSGAGEEEDGCCSDSTLDDSSFSGGLEPRGRCYTWPVPQAVAAQQPHCSSQLPPLPSCGSSATSSSTSRFPSLASIHGAGTTQELSYAPAQQQFGQGYPTAAQLLNPAQQYGQQHAPLNVPPLQQHSFGQLAPERVKPKRVRRRTADGGGVAAQSHKKPNPWGEESYSDLIARALCSATDGRLKLNEIYQWFSDNIPYFAQRSSQEEAQGWKNSIRHNLSLHSRFMRIQNEGAGKSSWWVINPDAKPGRNPRRRANTMESATKQAIDKKRRGARKRVESLVQQKANGGAACSSSMASILSSQHDLYPGDDNMGTPGPNAPPGGGPNFDTFRPRAQSTLSVTGAASRLSPTLETGGGPNGAVLPGGGPFDDFHFPSWMEEQARELQQASAGGVMNAQAVNELLDRTDQMKLEQQHSINGAIKMEPKPGTPTSGPQNPLLMPRNDTEAAPPPTTVQIKQEPQIPPPPSYQELSAVRRPAQLQTNPLLRQLGSSHAQMMQQQMKMGTNIGVPISTAAGPPPNSAIFNSAFNVFQQQQQQQQWAAMMGNGVGPMMQPPLPILGGQHHQYSHAMMGGLPLDLENVNAMSMDTALLGELDVDAVLRHELAQGNNHFDLP